jgi:hypothetical protein
MHALDRRDDRTGVRIAATRARVVDPHFANGVLPDIRSS